MIGSGIAGLGAAHALARGHRVEVLEREPRPGGHAHTVDVPRPGGGALALDTGFLVHNERNYPNLIRLFRELGVRTQPSEMGFAVSSPGLGLEYSGRRVWAQPHLLARPVFARLLREIVRFLRTARHGLDGRYADETLAGYVRAEGYSPAFRDLYLMPLTAALWSTAPARALEFPVAYALRFFDNHGLLGFRRHRWRTVTGGSRSYVRAIAAPLGERLRLGVPVREVRRDDAGVTVRTDDDRTRRYDAVVMAVHPRQALAMLADPSAEERHLLGAFGATRNEVVLHTDESLLPRRRSARAAWNYRLAPGDEPSPLPTMTYYLNKLQRLREPRHYCVTLNSGERIAEEAVLRRLEFEHPMYTFAALGAQAELPRLNGRRRTWYAGAWQGYGFHEDGLVSGLRAAADLGTPW